VRAFRPWSLLVILTAVAAALWGAARLNPLKEGLTASYHESADRTGAPVRTAIDVPSTRSLADAWNGRPPGVFSAKWNGALIVFSSGPLTLATTSDDGSRLYLDGRLVVDNGGPHSLTTRTATVELTSGVHALGIEYAQNGGQYGLEVAWGSSEADLAPVPSWALVSQPAGFGAAIATALIGRALVVAKVSWALAGPPLDSRGRPPAHRARHLVGPAGRVGGG
jgi:hypothetical protein